MEQLVIGPARRFPFVNHGFESTQITDIHEVGQYNEVQKTPKGMQPGP